MSIKIIDNSKNTLEIFRRAPNLNFLTKILSQRTRTAEDKREIRDFLKSPSATSFISNTLSNILLGDLWKNLFKDM